MQRYHMHPYCQIDGEWTFPEQDIRDIYGRMVEDRTVDMVFMGSGIDCEDRFVSMFRSDGVYPYVLFVDGRCAGTVWLNRIQYRWAQFHFCAFREFWGETTVELGRFCNTYLLNMKGEDDRYLFDMFVGILPARNRLAVRFVKKCYGTVSGELPKGVYNPGTGESEKAYIITLTREGLE